nr:chemotaxis protein CheB [Allomuricauda sp.]
MLFCGSSGAIDVLEQLLIDIKETDKIAAVVVLHRKVDVRDHLAQYLNNKTQMKVSTMEHGQKMEAGNVYLVPAGYHCILEKNMTLSLDLSEKVMFSRPSADVSLESFSYHLKDKLVAVIASGANADGANGVKWVKKRGGTVIIQDPEEAFAKSMPCAAIKALDKVDQITTSKKMYTTVEKYF